MKRILTLLLTIVICISLVGCNTIVFKSKRKITFQSEPRTDYARYLNTDWGMTVDEALNALGWEENTVVRNEPKDPKAFQAKLSIGRISVAFGEAYVSVVLTFTNINGKEPVLTKVRFRDIEENIAKEILNTLNEHYNTSITIDDNSGDFAQSFNTSDYYTVSTWSKLDEYYRPHLEKEDLDLDVDTELYNIAKTPLASAKFEVLHPGDSKEFLYNDLEGVIYSFTFDGTQAAVWKYLNQK